MPEEQDEMCRATVEHRIIEFLRGNPGATDQGPAPSASRTGPRFCRTLRPFLGTYPLDKHMRGTVADSTPPMVHYRANRITRQPREQPTTGSATAYGNTAYGSATTTGTYTPGQSFVMTKYGGTATIRVFKGEKPAENPNAFVAKEVLQYLNLSIER